jgi:riboflavin synthase
MFTGLVDDIGVVERAADTVAGRELRVRCRYDDVAPGESIALNGACLTARESGPGWFTVAAIATTLARTTIGSWREGTAVNLERAVRAGDRLGGHIVQGHVDGVGVVEQVASHESMVLIDVAVDDPRSRLAVLHGSIAVEGVSLTVNALPRAGVVQVAIIEYTGNHTTLGRLRAGDRVHVEWDVIGKYVAALLGPWGGTGAAS